MNCRYLQIIDKFCVIYCPKFVDIYNSFADINKFFEYISKSCRFNWATFENILQELWKYSTTPAILRRTQQNVGFSLLIK